MRLRRRQPPIQPRARIAAPQSRNDVFSYHANRSIREGSSNIGRVTPEQAEQPARRRASAKWLKRLPMLAALAAIAVCCVNVLSLSSDVKIVPINSATSSASTQLFLQNNAVYQQAAQKLFATSALNGNKLTVDTAHITDSLQTQFPELQNVSVTLPLIGHRPIIYLQPAAPLFFLTTQGGGVYILDKSGRALVGGNEAISQLGQLKLATLRDDSGVQVRLGQIALPSSDVAFIAQVIGQLQSKGLGITNLELPPAASELDVRMQGIGYTVKFNMQGDAREQAGAYLATKQYLDASHTPGQYIDVRVPERAYYK